jgi:hypothetical protein
MRAVPPGARSEELLPTPCARAALQEQEQERPLWNEGQALGRIGVRLAKRTLVWLIGMLLKRCGMN